MSTDHKNFAVVAAALTCLFVSPLARAQELRIGDPVFVDEPFVQPSWALNNFPGIEPIPGGFVVHSDYGVDSQAARFADDGSSLDVVPFEVPEHEQMSCIDTTCLIVDDRGNGQRMTVDGTFLDATPFPITEGGARAAAVRRLGTRWVVVGYPQPAGVSWVMVDTHGVVLEATRRRLPVSDTGTERYAGLECDAMGCLSSYTLSDAGLVELWARRISPTGATIGAPFLVSDDWRLGRTRVAHVAMGDVHAMFWGSDSTGLERAVRVRRDGTVLDATPIEVGPVYIHQSFRPACFAGGCLLATRVSNGGRWEIHTRVFSSTGTVGPDQPLLVDLPEREVDRLRLGCNPSVCMAVWHEGAPFQIFAHRMLDHTGTPLGSGASRPFTRSVPQIGRAIASGGDGFLAVFDDDRAEDDGLRAARMTPTATLDTESLELGRGNLPDVSFGTGVFAVVWSMGSRIQMRRVGEDGSLPSSTPLEVATSAYRPAVTFDGRNFLVVFERRSTLQGRRVSATGATLEPEPFEIDAARPHSLDVATGPTAHLVVWSETRSGRGEEIYGRRIRHDGSPLDSISFPIGTGEGDQENPRLAFDGENWLVVWSETSPARVRAARVATDGTVLDPLGIVVRAAADDDDFLQEVDVTFDGSHFVMVWYEVERTVSDGREISRETYNSVARVTPAGVLVDASPARMGPRESEYRGSGLAIASNASGTVILDSSHDPRPDLRALRATLYSVATVEGLGAPCEDGRMCASGFCADGVCCESACDGGCETCSSDGSCALRDSLHECRPAADTCDVAELCTGDSPACPVDDRLSMCGDSTDGGSVDGEVRDGGVGADAGPSPEAGGGCSVQGARLGDVGSLLFALAALALGARRRRQSP